MVMHTANSRCRRQAGLLLVEMLVAMAIILLVLLPLAGLYLAEGRLAGSYYHRAVAMEVVDGEMEVLLAGEWKSYPMGTTNYLLSGPLRSNLPPGNLSLAVNDGELRLEWNPADRGQGGAVIRTARIPR